MGDMAAQADAAAETARIDLGGKSLGDVPMALLLKSSAHLRDLNLMSNGLTTLPDEIGTHLVNLERLGLARNQLRCLPDTIGNLSELTELYLTSNKLTLLPASIGRLSKLRKLQASHNELRYLPLEMAELQSLELFRLSVNPNLREIPHAVLCLPSLAWMSLASTPWSPGSGDWSAMPVIEESSVVLSEAIGDGASGACLGGTHFGVPVAVKAFTSQSSPDGHFADELEISSLVKHECLTRVRGVVRTENTPPLAVMDLVPQHRAPLALKPNFRSVLRCQFQREMSLEAALRVARDVSSAMAHLHKSNIAHGDLYAHNVLTGPLGDSTLCDLGAAFIYPGQYAKCMERIELRAFGLLLEGLSGVTVGSPPAGTSCPLHELRRHCAMQEGSSFESISALAEKALHVM
jgi:hypothetical protein